MQNQTKPVLVLVVVIIMVVMSSFTVEGGGRGILYNKDQRLHHVRKVKSVTPSARVVENHHNIPRQNYDNWGANGGDSGGDDGTG